MQTENSTEQGYQYQDTGNGSRTHRHGRRHRRSPERYLWVLLAFLLPAIAFLLHAGSMMALAGSAGILSLLIAKRYRLQFMVVISMACMLTMLMLYVWHWADKFFISIFSENILHEKLLFLRGAVEALIVVAGWFAYRSIMRSLHIKMSEEWFVKKSVMNFLTAVLFFLIFCMLLWFLAYLFYLLNPGDRFDGYMITIASIALSLLLTGGLLAGRFFRKTEPSGERHHGHRHHHRHHNP